MASTVLQNGAAFGTEYIYEVEFTSTTSKSDLFSQMNSYYSTKWGSLPASQQPVTLMDGPNASAGPYYPSIAYRAGTYILIMIWISLYYTP